MSRETYLVCIRGLEYIRHHKEAVVTAKRATLGAEVWPTRLMAASDFSVEELSTRAKKQETAF